MSLLNCPFCGSQNVKEQERTHYGHGDCTCEVYVECSDCKAHGPDTGFYGNPDNTMKRKAIELWNKRFAQNV